MKNTPVDDKFDFAHNLKHDLRDTIISNLIELWDILPQEDRWFSINSALTTLRAELIHWIILERKGNKDEDPDKAFVFKSDFKLIEEIKKDAIIELQTWETAYICDRLTLLNLVNHLSTLLLRRYIDNRIKD
jgi:hypothetical protein